MKITDKPLRPQESETGLKEPMVTETKTVVVTGGSRRNWAEQRGQAQVLVKSLKSTGKVHSHAKFVGRAEQ